MHLHLLLQLWKAGWNHLIHCNSKRKISAGFLSHFGFFCHLQFSSNWKVACLYYVENCILRGPELTKRLRYDPHSSITEEWRESRRAKLSQSRAALAWMIRQRVITIKVGLGKAHRANTERKVPLREWGTQVSTRDCRPPKVFQARRSARATHVE